MLMKRMAQFLKPREPLTGSEWACRHMVLPQGSAMPGKYTTENAPYQKDVLDAMTDPRVVRLTMMFAAQSGKSTMVNCGIGYYMDYEPSTQIMVLPTFDMAEKYSKTSLAPMLSDVAVLAEKVCIKTRDSSNTILMKNYPGGSIVIAGANSASSLSQMPRRIIWMDEIDRYPESAGTEGNPVKLAEARATFYWNKKYIKTSTPTIKGYSRIEDAYYEGSMDEWSVECPECGKYQPYEFERIDFDTVSMACKYCGCLIPEQRWKQSGHAWIAEHPERVDNRSFHMNAFANPVLGWAELIDEHKKAYRRMKKYHDDNDMRTFVNTRLAVTWDITDMEEGAVDDNMLQKRAEAYGAELPDGVIVLTAAVDVQDNRLEVEVRGWARNYETWGIYKTEIYGELHLSETWDRMEEYLDRTFTFGDGRELGVSIFLIDSGGHHTNQVYKWSKNMRKKGKRCVTIKGMDRDNDIPLIYKKSIVSIRETLRDGTTTDRVIDRTVLQILGVNAGKEDISNRLKITEPGEGYCHFPSDPGRGYDEKYYKGLTSERRVFKQVNGKLKVTWEKKAGARNEPFDLLNYNYAAIELLRPDYDALEQKLKQGINYTRRTEKPKEKRPRRVINEIDGM